MFRHKRWPHLFAIAFILLAAFGGGGQLPSYAQTFPEADFYVTTTNDLTDPNLACVAPCSLRQAIEAANAAGPGKIIGFNIDNNDPGYDGSDANARTWTITLGKGLPPQSSNNPLPFLLNDNTIIDGNYQARKRGGNPNIFGPEIIIDGSNITSAGGILVYSNNNTVLGLGIVKFQGGNPTGTGIEVKGNNNKIQGNYIGLNKYGTASLGNTGPGIWVRGNGNLVGGDSSVSTTEFNVVSGNGADGMLVEGSTNQIRGNYIGTDRNGINAVPNAENGINVRIGASGNVIGTDANSSDAIYRNLVSGNKGYGIVIRDSANNSVYGNWVGLNDTGDTLLSNVKGGVQVLGDGGINTSGNVIGGTSTSARNYIGGNTGPGVYISGKFATGVTVSNNYIGLDFSGTVPISATTATKTQTYGVLIDRGATNNTIGGDAPIARNIISGNLGDGIRITGDINTKVFSNRNSILGNYIGVGTSDSFAIPNNGAGIYIGNNAWYTTIGGSEAQRNLIAFNGTNGIYLHPNTNSVTDPIITPPNTQVLLNTVQYNTANGVVVDSASFTSIQNTDVLGNGAVGILGTNALTTTLQGGKVWDNIGNGIQFDNGRLNTLQPTTVLNNGAVGVAVSNGRTTVIGGQNAAARTVISGNDSHAVQVSGGITTTVQFIDTNPSTLDGAPSSNIGDGVNASAPQKLYIQQNKLDKNGGAGVNVSGGQFVRVEGDVANQARTTVVSNTLQGVLFNNVVSGTVQFQDVLYNRGDGVSVQGASSDVSVFRNIIRYNGPQNAPGGNFAASCSSNLRSVQGQGVAVRNTSIKVRIIRTLFGQNCGLGILREPNGTAISTPNQGIQPPIITSLNQNGELRGKLQTTCTTDNCAGWIVELFKSDLVPLKPDGEGNTKLNTPTDQIKTFDAQGNFNFALTGGIPLQLLATATDKNGNTSEFGTFTITRSVTIAPPRTAINVIPTQVITYYHTVTNTGTLDDQFQLSYFSEKGLGSANVKLQPSGVFAVAAGKTMPVTVTLTLPGGTDPRVRAGTVEHTRITVSSFTPPRPGTSETVTASVTDTTVLTKSAAITVTPLTATGDTQAQQTFTYAHQITNNGNITATVTFAVETTPNWPSVLSLTTVTLAPGQTKTLLLDVTPPKGVTAGATAVSNIYVTVPEYPSQNKLVTDTTKVLVTSNAVIFPNRAGDGAAGQLATYLHTVQNLSNGSVKLKLVASSSLGSTVNLEAATPDIALDSQNTFTLGTTSGTNLLNFNAKVSIPSNAPVDSIDIVTIKLLDANTGAVIGTVQDRTTVTKGIRLIRLPIVVKSK